MYYLMFQGWISSSLHENDRATLEDYSIKWDNTWTSLSISPKYLAQCLASNSWLTWWGICYLINSQYMFTIFISGIITIVTTIEVGKSKKQSYYLWLTVQWEVIPLALKLMLFQEGKYSASRHSFVLMVYVYYFTSGLFWTSPGCKWPNHCVNMKNWDRNDYISIKAANIWVLAYELKVKLWQSLWHHISSL